jgi:hypothetical protein
MPQAYRSTEERDLARVPYRAGSTATPAESAGPDRPG